MCFIIFLIIVSFAVTTCTIDCHERLVAEMCPCDALVTPLSEVSFDSATVSSLLRVLDFRKQTPLRLQKLIFSIRVKFYTCVETDFVTF